MPEKLQKEVAKRFYEDSWTKDEILKVYKIRPKTLQLIIGKFKAEFVKES